MTPADLPLTDAEAETLFRGLERQPVVALAVSGGADSLALLHVAHRWATRRAQPPGLVVFTVDHGLRPHSAAEATMVAGLAAVRGLSHETLCWTGPKPLSGIEAAAREARYGLLVAATLRAGARILLTAHHRDDQAETVLMRLGRGSGLTGLGGMQPSRPLDGGVVLMRPFLDVPKARLVATVREAGLDPAEDAMNADPRFARARLRGLMPALAGEGIDAAALARLARQVRRADEALSAATRAFFERALVANPLGMARLGRDRFAGEPEEIRLRGLGIVIAAVGGSGEAPGEEKLLALDATARTAEPFRRTLGGAVIRTQGGALLFHREPGRLGIADALVPPGYSGRWDGRFDVAVGASDGLTLGPLAASGYAELPQHFRARPRAAVETVPAFRRGGRLVAVPSVGFVTPGNEELRALEVAAARLGTATVTATRSSSRSRVNF